MAMKPLMYFSEMESPMGPITIISTDKGVCRISFGTSEKKLPTVKAWAKKNLKLDEIIPNPKLLQKVIDQLEQYFYGERRIFDFELDLCGTPFQMKVWDQLMKINYGETKSYKEVAQSIHAPQAVRAVGGAVNRNPIPIVVPCHRVIGSNGSLVGYNGGIDKKEKLLGIEKALQKIS